MLAGPWVEEWLASGASASSLHPSPCSATTLGRCGGQAKSACAQHRGLPELEVHSTSDCSSRRSQSQTRSASASPRFQQQLGDHLSIAVVSSKETLYEIVTKVGERVKEARTSNCPGLLDSACFPTNFGHALASIVYSVVHYTRRRRLARYSRCNCIRELLATVLREECGLPRLRTARPEAAAELMPLLLYCNFFFYNTNSSSQD